MKNKAKEKWAMRQFVPDRMWGCASGWLLKSVGRRAEEILKDANYGTLFAYLFRRFGAPMCGSDADEALVTYYLTTPMDGVGFWVSCSPAGLLYCSGYALSAEAQERIHEWERGPRDRWFERFARASVDVDMREWWGMWYVHQVYLFGIGRHDAKNPCLSLSRSDRETCLRVVREYLERVLPPPEIHWVREFHPWMDMSKKPEAVPLGELPESPNREFLGAIEAGLRDLLRPVAVGDVCINACGRVEGCVCREVERSEEAGYGWVSRREVQGG